MRSAAENKRETRTALKEHKQNDKRKNEGGQHEDKQLSPNKKIKTAPKLQKPEKTQLIHTKEEKKEVRSPILLLKKKKKKKEREEKNIHQKNKPVNLRLLNPDIGKKQKS